MSDSIAPRNFFERSSHREAFPQEVIAPRSLLQEVIAPRSLLQKVIGPRTLLQEVIAPRNLSSRGHCAEKLLRDVIAPGSLSLRGYCTDKPVFRLRASGFALSTSLLDFALSTSRFQLRFLAVFPEASIEVALLEGTRHHKPCAPDCDFFNIPLLRLPLKDKAPYTMCVGL